MAEIEELHNREVFEPIFPQEITQLEKTQAMNSLIFLTEKKNGTFKAQVYANSSIQIKFILKQDAASLTVTTEVLLTTCVVDAKQNRVIITLDIPNAFVETLLPNSNKRIIITISGKLVGLLEEIPTEKLVQFQRGAKFICVLMNSSLLFYRYFREDFESIGFKVNPYNVCMANHMLKGKQQTVTWHVDDIKVSHIKPIISANV